MGLQHPCLRHLSMRNLPRSQVKEHLARALRADLINRWSVTPTSMIVEIMKMMIHVLNE